MTAAYKEKRNLVDQIKNELQVKIAEYAKYAEKGNVEKNIKYIYFFL